MRTEFADRVVVVTGAGSGIGRALAQGLAERGAQLAVSDIDDSGGSLPLAEGLRLETSEFLASITTDESIEAQRAYVRRTAELDDLPVAVSDEIARTIARGRFA